MAREETVSAQTPLTGGAGHALPAENPFSSDVCRTPWHAKESVSALNADVLDQLVESVGGRGIGPLMLLTAPRAGYGKTHLLGRVAAAAASQAVIVPVAFRSGDALSVTTLSKRGIEALAETAAGSDLPKDWSKLREASAQVVALLLCRLIESGQLPCANAEQAAKVLSGPVQEVFGEQGRARRIGDWIAHNRDGLCGPLAVLAARDVPLRAEALGSWMAALLDQSLHGGLTGTVEMLELTSSDEATGVPAWLRILALWRPVVLLVDHLDGFYRNPDAGIRIASMLMELIETHRLHVLLSLNQDVWQATFGHHLPSALEDRLTASQVLLRGLSEEDALGLLRLRLNQANLSSAEKAEFEQFVGVHRHFLGRPIGSVSARAFLRHCARQWELFHSAPPCPIAPVAQSPDLPELPPPSPPPAATEPPVNDFIPLLADAPELHEAAGAAPLPAIFDQETASEVQTMAEGLAEPKPALPQDEPTLVQRVVSQPPLASLSPTKLPVEAVIDDDLQIPAWNSIPATPPNSANGADATTPPSADAFVKLRAMLAQLRQPGHGQETPSVQPPAPPAPAPSPFRVPGNTTTGKDLPPVAAAVSSPFQVASSPSAEAATATLPPRRATPSSAAPSAANALQGRFQALRLQHQPEAMSQPLDHSRLADLIRLAGRRFPLVRFSEHELPGLPGRHALYWALHGIEVLFGLAPFSDAAYWRTLSGFAAGRLTDLLAQAERDGRAPARLKLVGFKTEREQLAWQNLQQNKVLPEPIQAITDIVHLDTEGLASLYAMQRIIKESESGVLQAEPSQVISVLARELDFFWKRITRVL